MTRATEDRFLGALLGLAIGDALGMPFTGLTREQIARNVGPVREFHPLIDPDNGDVAAGEVTDETETVLALSEVLTTTGGVLDSDLAGPRLSHLARSESRRWFPEQTLAGIRLAETADFVLRLDEDAPFTPDVLVRGVPVGLIQSVGPIDEEDLMADAEAAVLLSHQSTAAISAVAVVALIARFAAIDEGPPTEWAARASNILGGQVADQLVASISAVADQDLPGALDQLLASSEDLAPLAAAIVAASRAERFEDAVFAVVEAGGPTDSAGALAGAFAGARFGSSGIPQGLIDGLGCRIYVTLAGPWLLKAARKRAGAVIDLLPRFDMPRPDMPPRI